MDGNDAIFDNWQKIKIVFHKRGIHRKHRCNGSGFVFNHNSGKTVVREHD